MDYRNRVYYFVSFGIVDFQQEVIKSLKRETKTVKFHSPYEKGDFTYNLLKVLKGNFINDNGRNRYHFLHYVVGISKSEKEIFEEKMDSLIKYENELGYYYYAKPYYYEISKDILGQ